MARYDRQAARQTFDRDGYTVVRGLFTKNEIDEIHLEIARYVRDVAPSLPPKSVFYENPDDPATLKQLEHMSGHDAFFKRYLEDERFFELGEWLLDGPVTAENLQWFDKPPAQSSPTPAHQDGFYFCLKPNEALNMWLALDEIDESNGCIRYVVGSHRHGLRPHGNTNTLGFSQGLSDWGPEDDANEAAIIAAPGDLIVHHSLTIHRADANQSKRRRRAMGGVYYSHQAKLDQEARDNYLRNLGELLETKSRQNA
jgi:phytanoyl-CoA hydroxylase